MFSELPLDVLHRGTFLDLRRLTIRWLIREDAILEAALLENSNELLCSLGIALMFRLVEGKVDPFAEGLAIIVILAELALAPNVKVQGYGPVNGLVEILFASRKLLTTGTRDVLAGLLCRLRITSFVGEIESKVTTTLKKSFLGGARIG